MSYHVTDICKNLSALESKRSIHKTLVFWPLGFSFGFSEICNNRAEAHCHIVVDEVLILLGILSVCTFI